MAFFLFKKVYETCFYECKGFWTWLIALVDPTCFELYQVLCKSVPLAIACGNWTE